MSQTVERGLMILNALAEAGPSTPQLLAEELDLNRTVVHRILQSLLETEVVEKKNGIFRLAPEITRIAHSVERDLRSSSLIEITKLGELIQFPIFVYVRDGDKQIALLSYVPPINTGIRLIPQIGYATSLEMNPTGLSLTAFGPANIKQQVLSKSIHPKKDIDLIKHTLADGHSISDVDSDIDFKEISVPIMSHGISNACITAFLPKDQEVDDKLITLEMKKSASAISENLEKTSGNL